MDETGLRTLAYAAPAADQLCFINYNVFHRVKLSSYPLPPAKTFRDSNRTTTNREPITRATSDAQRITTSPAYSGENTGREAEKISQRKGLSCHICKRLGHVINDCKIWARKCSSSSQTVLIANVLPNPVGLSDSRVRDKLCSESGEHSDVVSLNVPPFSKPFWQIASSETSQHIDLVTILREMSGHLVVRKSTSKYYLTFLFYRLTLIAVLATFVKLKGESGTSIKPSPLQRIPVMEELFSTVVIDCVGPLPKSKWGHQFLLTIIDVAIRYIGHSTS